MVEDLVGIPVLRQASKQLPDKPELFLLLLLLFLDPRNIEQAEAGAAPLLREGGRQKAGDVNVELSCSANAPPSGQLGASRIFCAFERGVTGFIEMEGWDECAAVRQRMLASVLLSLACLLAYPLLWWSVVSLM